MLGGDEGRRHIRLPAKEVLVVKSADAVQAVAIPPARTVGESMEQAELVDRRVFTVRADGGRHPEAIVDFVEMRLIRRFAGRRQQESKFPARHTWPRIARQRF